MKNESNRSPDALSKAAELGATAPARPPSGAAKAPPKRGDWVARTVHEAGQGWITAHFVPVSFVAKDWNVTSRRIRSLLAAERLQGRRGDNGYWEVAYPYRFIMGTRGPVLRRQQKPKRGRPKAELRAE